MIRKQRYCTRSAVSHLRTLINNALSIRMGTFFLTFSLIWLLYESSLLISTNQNMKFYFMFSTCLVAALAGNSKFKSRISTFYFQNCIEFNVVALAFQHHNLEMSEQCRLDLILVLIWNFPSFDFYTVQLWIFRLMMIRASIVARTMVVKSLKISMNCIILMPPKWVRHPM